MADVLATNNAVSSLAAGITNVATTITVPTGEGARFPAPSAGNYFYLTLIDTLGNFEIVKCTARATDSMTVTRAQDNTTAKAFPGGSSVQLLPVAALVTDLFAAINAKLNSASYTAADVLAKLLTVDGVGSNLDADKLDGQDGSYYTAITSRLGYTPINKAGDSGISGNLAFNAGARYVSVVDGVGSFMALGNTTDGASLTAYTKSHGGGLGGSFVLMTIDPADNSLHALLGNPSTAVLSWNGYTVWTQGNDGAGTGLDADLLDGQDGSFYRSAANLNAGTIPDARLPSYLQAAAVLGGTYTPTATRNANVTGETLYTVTYIRFLTKIFAFGRIDINGTGAGNIDLDLSLPVTSNLSAVESLCGVINQSGGAGYSGAILGNVAADRANIVINVGAAGNNAYSFWFAYNII